MKTHTHSPIRSGFTLMETVIAIGVIAVLITGFIAVFAPAVDGIRRSISGEEASRLTSTLERELVTLRIGQVPEPGPNITGFDKAFEWIKDSDQLNEALLIYQYRGSIDAKRDDGTPLPFTAGVGISGRDYVTVPMLRRKSDTARLAEDFEALDGRVFVVRCTQLVYDPNGALIRGTSGEIVDPKNPGNIANTAANYPEAVLTFAADFFSLPSRNPQYLQGDGFNSYFNDRMTRPMFTRNIAVRR